MSLDRRTLLGRSGALFGALGVPALARPVAAPGTTPEVLPKILRVAASTAEVGFDPPQVSDQTSVVVNAHIFEPPLTYDLLARPAVLRPLTAAALPEVLEGGRHFIFTLRAGIFFADDPAFGGRPRELVAEDYVFSIKRFFDPRLHSEHLYQFENAQILGMAELRRRAIGAKRGLDYDAPVEGLRALDRYRFEVRLAEPDPRFVDLFANAGLTGALAREVVQAYGDELMAHPVGTGPFRLKDWRRGSRIVLERNPGFREQRFDSVAPADDPAAQALAERLAGRRLPLVDQVHVAIIEEEQPRWLAFDAGEIDVLALPAGFAPLAMPGGRLAPYLARRGVQARRTVGADTRFTFMNLDDPQLGGLAPARVALRRAIALAFDNEEEIRLVLRGQAVPAQTLMAPAVYGYDPALHTEMGAGDLARARALLDTWGYADRDGDGWREHPDGQPLTLRLAGTANARQRAINELWKKRMDAIGLRIQFETSQFGELIKKTLAGQLQMWGYTWAIGSPDGDFFLAMAYGPNAGQSNDARFRLPAFDALYRRQHGLPNGPERAALMREAMRLMLAHVPYLPHSHAIVTDLTQARVQGYWRHPFNRDSWRSVALD